MLGWAAKATTYGQVLLYAAAAVAIAFAIGGGLGVKLGRDWEQGKQAKTENKALRSQIADATTALKNAQGAAAQISRDADTASTTLGAISKGLSDDIESNRQKAAAAGAAMEAAIARNPALLLPAADAEFMRAWNEANRGDPAGTPGTRRPGATDRRRPQGSVPGGSAAGAGFIPGGPGSQPSAERRDVSRLSHRQDPPGGSGASTRAIGNHAHRARTARAGEEVNGHG